MGIRGGHRAGLLSRCGRNSPSPGGLHAVKLSTGERAWFTPPPPPKCGQPARGCNGAPIGCDHRDSRDRVFRIDGRRDPRLLDARWHDRLGVRHQPRIRYAERRESAWRIDNGPAPVVVDGTLYVNSGYGAFGSANRERAAGLCGALADCLGFNTARLFTINAEFAKNAESPLEFNSRRSLRSRCSYPVQSCFST